MKNTLLKILQHILITTAAVVLLLYAAGTIVVVRSYARNEIHRLNPTDQQRKFDESVFFNTVFGQETEHLLKYVTIRTQLETDAVYDPDKEIDIESYNARHDSSYVPAGEPSVRYHLGDLLKWSKYGFDYSADTYATLTVSGNASTSDTYDGGDVSALVNRYKTADGHLLEEMADNAAEYGILADDLQSCAEDLYINYTDYLKYNDYFDPLNSNIRYYICMGEGRDRTVYTNTSLTAADAAKADAEFKKYGRYIHYDTDSMRYETNTAINESTFNALIASYRYAYPDDSVIYIAADMSMPADDAIRSAATGFMTTYLPDRNLAYGIVFACVLAYLILLVVCTIREGRVKDEDGCVSIRLTEFDHTPIELWFIIGCVIFSFCVLLPMTVASGYFDSMRYEIMDIRNDIYVYAVFAVIVFVLDILFLWLYYSLVRRIKAHHIWKQSFLYKIIHGIGQGFMHIYDNGDLIVRSVVPFAGLILVNLVLIIRCFYDMSCYHEYGSEGHQLLALMCAMLILLIDTVAGILIFRQMKDRRTIVQGMQRIISGDLSYRSDESSVHGDNRDLAVCVNSIGESVRVAVEQSMKDERMKTELLANVSHDIRTPLTSIINYVDLIKRENIEDEKIRQYVAVLDEKSQRLKTLTDDLIEASKVSSGNVEMELIHMNMPEMLTQALAEFDDKMNEQELSVVVRTDGLTDQTVLADGRSLWRVLENLLGNVCKYAMPKTRVFIDMFNRAVQTGETETVLRITNTSRDPLPADLSDLTERFSRGDSSRTSEGSGLGLSIAKSLTELMGGTFRLYSEADLFKAEISFRK